jgi:hypothetical protein
MFPIFLPSARPPFGTIEDRLSCFIRFAMRPGVCMNKVVLPVLKSLRLYLCLSNYGYLRKTD